MSIKKKRTTSLFLRSVAALAIITLAGCVTNINEENKQMAINFAHESVIAITSNWDPNELQSRAHPYLLATLNKSSLSGADYNSLMKSSIANYFKTLRKLGKLKDVNCSITDLQQAAAHAPNNGEYYIFADYTCDAQYENGPAKLMLEIIQDNQNSSWKINLFRVDSPLFLSNKETNTKKSYN